MNRLRRPWPATRRDTDGVQLNTLDSNGKVEAEEKGVPEKTGLTDTIEPVDFEHGHLVELEVDVDKVLHESDVKDLEDDTSPYPEVRAVVPETDDPTIPVNTLRMWILGIIWTLLGAGVNQFFSLRYPAVHIVSLVAELLTFPMGVALAHIIPICSLNLGRFGVWRVNPDRHFNIKEHVVIVIMSNVTIGYAGGADSTSIIQAALKFYDFKLSPGFSVLVVLCCQLLGFGVAGLCAPWLVEPAAIIWPGVLGNCALLNTLHSKANAPANGWNISRLRFFMIAMISAFCWYWFPGLIFVGLSYFTWICWIVPKNVVVNQLFGMINGLGLSPITFDWSQVAYVSRLQFCSGVVGRPFKVLNLVRFKAPEELGLLCLTAGFKLIFSQLQHQPASISVVGRNQRICRVRILLLDRLASLVLHEHLVHRIPATDDGRCLR